MPNYQDDLKNKQAELIRKALDGSAFVAPPDAAVINSLTTGASSELTALPTEWDDLGELTSDGMQHGRETSQSEIVSFGRVSPSRTDITADTTTIQVTAQETKALTIALGTGADLSAITADPVTGEVDLAKPTRAASRHYRLLTLMEDDYNGDEIWIARFFPRAKVTAYSEQNYSSGDEALPWGVTFTAEVDSTLGYSERWLFGGPGWNALRAKMNIADTTP
jgi:hypothetical protein